MAEQPGFELLALAAFARPGSQREIAERISANLRSGVSQPTVRTWLRTQLPRLARPTVSIKEPREIGVRIVLFLFRRKPASGVALSRTLAREPLVSRIDRLSGAVNLAAEVVVGDQSQLDDLIERFEPDEVHEIVRRVERTRVPLRHLGRAAARNG